MGDPELGLFDGFEERDVVSIACQRECARTTSEARADHAHAHVTQAQALSRSYAREARRSGKPRPRSRTTSLTNVRSHRWRAS